MFNQFINTINIQLDPSVHSITKVAAMCLSGAIANGIVFAKNENPNIKICKDKIEFGKCLDSSLQGVSGNIFPNFYLEYGNLIYYYDKSYKFSLFGKELDYQGFLAPEVPDDPKIFALIYPKFAK